MLASHMLSALAALTPSRGRFPRVGMAPRSDGLLMVCRDRLAGAGERRRATVQAESAANHREGSAVASTTLRFATITNASQNWFCIAEWAIACANGG